MDRSYFEQLHVEEARRKSWRMLDEALDARAGGSPLRRLRRSVGRALMVVGSRLADESAQTRAEAAVAQPCQC